MVAMGSETLVLVILLGVSSCVAWRVPHLVAPMLLLLAPLRIPIASGTEVATVFVVGAGLGWGPSILAGMRLDPKVNLAFWALASWALLSWFWARQPAFVSLEAGKWILVALAATIGFHSGLERPGLLLGAALASILPSALWAFGERIGWVPPRGDLRELQARLIVVGNLVRGRAWLAHPNRLAEHLDMLGLLVASLTALRPVRLVAVAGLLSAGLGSYATGSMAGLAVLLGGAAVTSVVAFGLTISPGSGRSLTAKAERSGGVEGDGRPSNLEGRRVDLWSSNSRGPILLALSFAVAAMIYGWVAHGGLTSRATIYDFAFAQIRERPLLGVGAGNYPLLVAAAQPSVDRAFFGQHCHSLILQLAIEVGWVGVGIGAFTFGFPLWRGFQLLKGDPIPQRVARFGAIAAILGLLAHNLVSYFLTQPANGIVPGVLLGLAAAPSLRGKDVRDACESAS